jgi:guanine deaminase
VWIRLQHAPQYPNLGLGQEYELLDWLQQLTFPREAKFTDSDYAHKVYDEVVRRNLNAGVSPSAEGMPNSRLIAVDHQTTTCSYYASQHVSSAKVLADVVLQRGEYIFVQIGFES